MKTTKTHSGVGRGQPMIFMTLEGWESYSNSRFSLIFNEGYTCLNDIVFGVATFYLFIYFSFLVQFKVTHLM